jgi:hypothetical protein
LRKKKNEMIESGAFSEFMKRKEKGDLDSRGKKEICFIA